MFSAGIADTPVARTEPLLWSHKIFPQVTLYHVWFVLYVYIQQYVRLFPVAAGTVHPYCFCTVARGVRNSFNSNKNMIWTFWVSHTHFGLCAIIMWRKGELYLLIHAIVLLSSVILSSMIDLVNSVLHGTTQHKKRSYWRFKGIVWHFGDKNLRRLIPLSCLCREYEASTSSWLARLSTETGKGGSS